MVTGGESVLFVVEQPGLLRLIFGFCDGAGFLGLLQVNQLLTQRAGAGMLGVAITDGGHAAAETKQGRKGERGGNNQFFHVVL